MITQEIGMSTVCTLHISIRGHAHENVSDSASDLLGPRGSTFMRTMRTIAAAFSPSMGIDLHASNANNSCSFL